MGACCKQTTKKQKLEREISYYENQGNQNNQQQQAEHQKKGKKKQRDQQLYNYNYRPPPSNLLKGKGISIGTAETSKQQKLTAEQIKQKQLEAAEKRLEGNQNRGLTTQAQIDMLFKAEREKDAEKFKNGNEQYYLKYK